MAWRASFVTGVGACLLALGLAGGASAAAPAEAKAVTTAAAAGQRLNLPRKSPQILPPLNSQGPAWLPVKEALVYANCTVVWRSTARLLQITATNGSKARLVLGEPYLFESVSRTALAAAPRLEGGALALPEADLRLVLSRVTGTPPLWEPASAAEIAGVLSLYRGTVPAEPAVEATVEPELAPKPSATPTGPRAPAHILQGGRVNTVVLDAGHGGYDPGAHGRGGLHEKDVCLDIVLRAQAELKRQDPHLEVVLTRKDDSFISLRQRTEVANGLDADLFVSVHNNASPNRKSKGTQVFFYDQATSDRAAADLVSRENEDVNELDVLLMDLAKSVVRDESIQLASKVQGDLGGTLGLKHRDLSYAPFYVLARTKMPAVLVEVAFITHPDEEKLLASAAWRQKVAASIARGILAYRQQVESKR